MGNLFPNIKLSVLKVIHEIYRLYLARCETHKIYVAKHKLSSQNTVMSISRGGKIPKRSLFPFSHAFTPGAYRISKTCFRLSWYLNAIILNIVILFLKKKMGRINH